MFPFIFSLYKLFSTRKQTQKFVMSGTDEPSSLETHIKNSTMASASTANHPKNGGEAPKSHFNQTVCLADWWLVMAENDSQERRLAVAGFTSREKQAMRVFSSAPILKRYDMFTLETTDGIHVILKGFINKARTIENGFPSEINNYFLLGFPSCWKEYEEKFMVEEGGQAHLDHEKDLGLQEKMDVKGMQKSKNPKSSPVPLGKKFDIVSMSERNLNTSCTSLGGNEKEANSGGPTVEDHTSVDIPMNCQENKMDSSIVGGNIKSSAATDKVVDDCLNHDSGGIVSARHSKLRDRRKVNIKGDIDKEKDKKTRPVSKLVSEDNPKDNILPDVNSLSDKGKVSSMKTRRRSERNLNTSCTSLGGIEKEANSGGPTVEDHTIVDIPTNCPKNKMDLSIVGGNIKSLAATDKVVDDCLNHDSGGIVSARHSKLRDRRKVNIKGDIDKEKDKKTSPVSKLVSEDNQKDNILPDLNSLSDKGKVSSMKTRRRSERNLITSCTGLGGIEKEANSGGPTVEDHTSVSIPTNCPKYNMDSSIVGGNIKSPAATDKVVDDCLNHDSRGIVSARHSKLRDQRKVKIKGDIDKEKEKKTSPVSKLVSEDNQKDIILPDVNSISDKGKVSSMKTRRRLGFETPEMEKEKVPSASPQSTSFKRSRSGRLLIGTLEFWRNQRAVYNVDRTITGIEDSLHPEVEQQRKGSGSAAQRKRTRAT